MLTRKSYFLFVSFCACILVGLTALLSAPTATALPPAGPCAEGTPESLRVENDESGRPHLFVFAMYQCSRPVEAVLTASVRQVLPDRSEFPIDNFGGYEVTSAPFVRGMSPGFCQRTDPTLFRVYYGIQIDMVQYSTVVRDYTLPCADVPGMGNTPIGEDTA